MIKYAVKKVMLTVICFAFLLAAALGVYLSKKTDIYVYADDKTVVRYQVGSADELAELASNVNNGVYDGYYGVVIELTDNISLDEVCSTIDGENGWKPIGSFTYPFKGTFDGAGYTINGLKIDRADSERIGLFGEIGSNATVKNLTVFGDVKGGNYTGGIVGYNRGIIENCTNKVSVTAKNGSMHIGGVVGYNEGSVTSSNNSVNITLGFVTTAGGIVGSNAGTVEKSCNLADISSANPMIGGIAGNNLAVNGKIDNCLNVGKINGKSTVGGIVGNNQGKVCNVFNRAEISSTINTVGGIVGSNESSGSISYVLSVSTVIGADDIAAVCGYNLGLITNCFYDNSEFSGAIVNGITAEKSFGLSTRVAVHSDVLTNSKKMSLLNDENNEMWVKRETTSTDCYYPELKCFYDNNVSDASCGQVSRETIPDDEITLSDTSLVYNGQSREVEVYSGDTLLEINQDYSATYSDNLNAGTAKVSLTMLNRFKGFVIKDFTIVRAELSVVWDCIKFTYNGTAQNPTLKISDGLVDGEAITFSYDKSCSINVGTYNIAAVLANTPTNANYYLPFTQTSFEISEAEITIVWSDENFTYNGEVQIPTASVDTGRIGTENIIFRYEYSANINAGAHTINAYLEDTEINRNYTLKSETHTYEILKQPISVVWSESEFYYNGEAQYPTAEVASGRIGDDDISFVYSEYAENIAANEDDGYTVLVQLADTTINANYAFNEERYNYFIKKSPLIIGWWDTPLVYSGVAQYPGFYIESGRIGTQDITFEVSDYSENIGASDGGYYRVEITLADTAINENYFLPITVREYDILKADFNPSNAVEFRSKTFSFDGAVKSIYISGEVPVGITVVYENNSNTEIGEYTVKAIFSADLENYNPLKINVLNATVYIANMTFKDTNSGITVTNKDEADYSLSLKVIKTDKSDLDESGKELLLAYIVNFENGISEFSVPLTEKQRNNKGIKVVYKNTAGETKIAEFKILGNQLIFTASNLTEFAVLVDHDLLPLWLGIGGGALVVIIVVLFIIILKKRRSVAGNALALSVVDSGNSVGSDNCLAIRKNDILNLVEGIENGNANEAVTDNIICDRAFTLDGVYCLNYDWFLKSLCFKTTEKQKLICGGDFNALLLSESVPKNSAYWCGKRYKLKSASYLKLLERAKEAIDETA